MRLLKNAVPSRLPRRGINTNRTSFSEIIAPIHNPPKRDVLRDGVSQKKDLTTTSLTFFPCIQQLRPLKLFKGGFNFKFSTFLCFSLFNKYALRFRPPGENNLEGGQIRISFQNYIQIKIARLFIQFAGEKLLNSLSAGCFSRTFFYNTEGEPPQGASTPSFTRSSNALNPWD
eukprot:TRINITY_DN6402_c0_g3_i2.p1 TRINITY_DN6402_c0_g3~~TRINITY_DN6402_c0_g3_i2.p1  ORF type:complete len:173 (-),score=14.38 TRINITY_DN6402_c0_g3_i2:35-553(-)